MNQVTRTSRLDLDDVGDASGNGNALAPRATVDVAMTRAASEVMAAMSIAKKFPRDEQASYQRVMQACKRRTLAESAEYEYPRGGEMVRGPSIRLAEVLAQAWGNIDFGIVELEQRDGESQIMTYAWDLETNTRQTKVFTVKHERHTKREVKKLSDPRDVYEMAANQGARRLRACILGVIPGDVVDAARAECNKTMQGHNKEPMADRVRAMLAVFQEEMGVTKAMIEARLGHGLDAITERQILQLKRIYAAIRDGMGTREQYFSASAAADSKLDKLDEPEATPAAPAQTAPKQTKPAEASGSVAPPQAPPAAKQPEPPPASDEVDISTTIAAMAPEAFEKLLREKSVDHRVSRSDFNGGVFKHLAGKGKTKLAELDDDERMTLYAAVVNNALDYRTGKVSHPAT